MKTLIVGCWAWGTQKTCLVGNWLADCVFWILWRQVPSGQRLHNYGKSPFFIGKSTINGNVQYFFVCLPCRVHHVPSMDWLKGKIFNRKRP
jgi:hypothetical protein